MSSDSTVPTFGHVSGPASDAGIDPGHPSAPERLEPIPDLDDLELLAQDLADEVVDTSTYDVDTRPRYSVEYRLNFEGRELDGWRKQSKDRKASEGIDAIKLAGLVCAWTCVAIYRDGRKLTDDGEPLTFRSQAIHELLGARGAVDAARKLYGRDGELDKTARAILADAGWGDDARPSDVDPTRGR